LGAERTESRHPSGPQESPDSRSDLRLIALIAEGDGQAFHELYRKYQARLSRFLFNLVRHPHLVEEVLDDTMMVVWERGGSFKGESKLSTWIFAIAYRKAMRALVRYDEPLEDLGAENRESGEASPEDEYGMSTVHGLLRKAMAELSPDHRAVVDLTYFHELGYREIAEILGCPVDTVKTRMFYARRHLRRCVEGDMSDWI
jgi:RNA polymerase sigma factor (sigma-70 family)